jgi:pyruvate/2-oxoglutarate/acetoin dehydrogenase E1 component
LGQVRSFLIEQDGLFSHYLTEGVGQNQAGYSYKEFDRLLQEGAPIVQVGTPHIPIPASLPLEKMLVPDEQKISKAIQTVLTI